MSKPESKSARPTRIDPVSLPQEVDGARWDLWRVQPGNKWIGHMPARSSMEEIGRMLSLADPKYCKKGAMYQIRGLREEDGQPFTSQPFAVCDVPDDEVPATNSTTGTPWDQVLAQMREHHEQAITRMATMQDSINRTWMERQQADEQRRADEHMRALERLKAETEAQVSRVRAEAEATRERERQWIDSQIQRDREFFSRLVADREPDPNAAISTLALLRAVKDLSVDEDDSGPIDRMVKLFGDRLVKKVEEPLRNNGKRNPTPAPKVDAKADASDDQAEDDGEESDEMGASLVWMVKHLDRRALTAACVSLVERGTFDRDTLELMTGDAARARLADVLTEAELDKLARAAQDALHALDRSSEDASDRANSAPS
jgi:hypothetical protein